MSDKVLVILSSGEKKKVVTGLMYATNALKYSWMADVKVVLFGPSQQISLKDKEIQEYLRKLVENLNSIPSTCKYIAEQEGFSQALSELGLDVVYVGPLISDYIKRGFVPLVF